MKKILSFVFTMMLVLGLMIAPVSAAAGDVAIDASDVTAKPGETVTLTFSVSATEAVKFATYAFSFQYDSANLTYVADSATGAVFNPEYSAGTAFATWSTGSDVTYNGGEVLLSVQFKVNPAAQPGDIYPVSLAIDNVRNAKGEYLTATAYNGSVTIVCPGHKWDNGTVTTNPGCESEGVMTYTCTVCGDTYTEAIPAAGHNYDKGVVTTNPGCESEGVMTYTCTVCGDTYTEAIPAAGHNYESVVTTPATCTADGVKTITCTVCGHTTTEVIKAHGHDWTDWELVKKPTETEWGLEQRTCRICGEIETRDVAPAKDQVPDTGVRSTNYAWVAVAAVAGVAVTFVWKRKTAK